MTFSREKRMLLGALAALAPLPLPFNGILEWSFVAAYWMALAVFMYRARSGSEIWLPNWVLNLIGIAYLPVVYLDFTRFWGGQVLRPLLHLAGFTLVVKLFAVRREREKWQLLIGIYFIFLAAMGTSVHPSIVFYLVAFLALSLATLTRFATYHYLSVFQQSAASVEDAPLRRFMITGVTLTLLFAALLFPLLPRVGTPYIVAGSGMGGQRRSQSSGFSDIMSLDGIGRIRTNSDVAMRLKHETAPPIDYQLRYKGATYDLFEGKGWRRTQRVDQGLRRNDFGFFELQEGSPLSWVQVWVEPLGVPNLFVPVGALAIDVSVPRLGRDKGGAVFLPQRAPAGVEYRVALGTSVESAAIDPDEESQALDLGGVTPRITQLAEDIMGEGELVDRIERLELHMVTEYGYTLDLLSGGSDDPIGRFLFEDRRGHCELFASSMVLMLRSQGIAARLVTGFLGGEPSPVEEYYIVRQSNAHAWVEAFVPGSGWRVYEPTPPSGRPGLTPGSLLLKMRQAYDYLVFRWDRYILTFGAADQVSLFGELREFWTGLKERWFGESERAAIDPGPAEAAAAASRDGVADRRPGRGLGEGFWASILILALLVVWWGWRHSPKFDATQAYRLMRRRARRRGLDLPPSLGPQAVGERVKFAWPQSAPLVDPIVSGYLQESFGGRRLDTAEVAELRQCLRDVGPTMRKAA